MDVLTAFQSNMERHLSAVGDKLDSIDTRMDALESRQEGLEEQVQALGSGAASRKGDSTPVSLAGKRKRRTPVGLQSKIRKVYTSFDETKEFNLKEPINSKHNIQIVEEITQAIGTEKFSEDLIQRGCRTYKKTLAEKDKQSSTPVKRKKQNRSLKQRSYERRGRAVKGPKEAKYWVDITPEMMSDEEQSGDIYVRHPPLYRSDVVSHFIKKLDLRLAKKKTPQPRKERKLGSPVPKPIPRFAKQWTIKAELRKKSVADADDVHEESDIQELGQEEIEAENDSNGSGTESDL